MTSHNHHHHGNMVMTSIGTTTDQNGSQCNNNANVNENGVFIPLTKKRIHQPPPASLSIRIPKVETGPKSLWNDSLGIHVDCRDR